MEQKEFIARAMLSALPPLVAAQQSDARGGHPLGGLSAAEIAEEARLCAIEMWSEYNRHINLGGLPLN